MKRGLDWDDQGKGASQSIADLVRHCDFGMIPTEGGVSLEAKHVSTAPAQLPVPAEPINASAGSTCKVGSVRVLSAECLCGSAASRLETTQLKGKKTASGGFLEKDWPRERGQYVPSVITSSGGWERTCPRAANAGYQNPQCRRSVVCDDE